MHHPLWVMVVVVVVVMVVVAVYRIGLPNYIISCYDML